MADLGSSKITLPKRKAKANTAKSAVSATTTWLTPKQFNYVQWIIGGVVVILLGIIVAAIVGYAQLVNTMFTDYRNIVNEYNDDRYSKLEEKNIELESRIKDLQSAQQGSISSTTTK